MNRQCDTLAHAVRGPVTLITVGALFALNNFTPFGFDKTWPVILIVFGLLTLVGRGTAPARPAAGPNPGAPPPAYPPPSPQDTPPPAASYRQGPYSQRPGTGVPQRDPGQTPPTGGSQ